MAHSASSARKRIRAHANPLSDDVPFPASPDLVDWSEHYPAYFPTSSSTTTSSTTTTTSTSSEATIDNKVRFADVGCGFGGLLVALGPLFPDKLILGLEIRDRVVQIDQKRIVNLRRDAAREQAKRLKASGEDGAVSGEAAATSTTSSTSSSSLNFSSAHNLPNHHYENISVVRTNIMKYAPNYFEKGQVRRRARTRSRARLVAHASDSTDDHALLSARALARSSVQLEKMFILFADPHFKKSNFRRRVINQNFLAYYAYTLKVGGLLYMITDVHDLYTWQYGHLKQHPLFEEVPLAELADDPCVPAIRDKTEEGQKVARQHGEKYMAVFRRIQDD